MVLEVEVKEKRPIPGEKTLCPYCGKQVNAFNIKEEGPVSNRVVYSCPHCKKILGVGRTPR